MTYGNQVQHVSVGRNGVPKSHGYMLSAYTCYSRSSNRATQNKNNYYKFRNMSFNNKSTTNNKHVKSNNYSSSVNPSDENQTESFVSKKINEFTKRAQDSEFYKSDKNNYKFLSRRRSSDNSTGDQYGEFFCRKQRFNSTTYSDTTSTESDGLVITVSRSKSPSELETQHSSDNDNLNLNLLTTGTESALSTEDYTSESGCENETQEELTTELRRSIVECLEEYFSDESLSKDLFLLKHVKRRKDGFVSLKLMSSYKRIKKLTKSWRVVSLAAKTSDVLEVDNTGKKVRRKLPLPDALKFDVPTSRTLLATDLTTELGCMEKLASVFGAFGSVASLQVVRPRPGGCVPPILQQVAERLPQITQNSCAIIEYEDVWGAGKALRDFNVPEVSLHIIKHPRKRQVASTSGSTTPRSPRQQFKSNSPNKPRSRQDESSDNIVDSSGSEGDNGSDTGRKCKKISFKQNKDYTNLSSPVRKFSNLAANSMSKTSMHITRSPRGPDGTIGFSNKK